MCRVCVYHVNGLIQCCGTMLSMKLMAEVSASLMQVADFELSRVMHKVIESANIYGNVSCSCPAGH